MPYNKSKNKGVQNRQYIKSINGESCAIDIHLNTDTFKTSKNKKISIKNKISK